MTKQFSIIFLVAIMAIAFALPAATQTVTTTVTPEVTQTVTTEITTAEKTVTKTTADSISWGPLLGFSFIPQAGVPMGLTFGGYVGEFNLEAWKFNLTSPYGLWLIGGLWTPQIEEFGYRMGLKVLFDYQGTVIYEGFGFVMGVSVTWGPLQLYADLNVLPFGVVATVPVVGLNILFAELIPGRNK